MIGFGLMHGWMADFSQVATGGLVAAVWQGVLLAAVVGLGLRLLPRTPAAVRFAIWFAVFLVVAYLPAVSLWPRAASSMQAGGRGAWLTLDARWSVAIAAVWVAASLVRAGTLVVAAFRVRTLWKRAKPVEVGARHPTPCGTAAMDGAQGLIDEAEVSSGARRAQICTSDEVDRPTVIGFFAPKILIPTWLLEKLTGAELEQIVLHEAGHLSRADDWMNLFQKVALVLFPLNPALAWVERRLCFERELACDERVLQTTHAPKAYATCLATLAEHRLGRRGLALALGALGRGESELGRRVGRILRRGDTMRPVHTRLVLGGAMLGLLGGAVGLERCPQVIGFAVAGKQVVAHAEPGTNSYEAITPRTAIRQVEAIVRLPLNNEIGRIAQVPHETLAVASELGGNQNAPTGITHTVSGDKSLTQPFRMVQTAVSTSELRNRPRLVSDVDRSDPAEGIVQLVIMTTWQAEDGSRMVTTMARTYAPSRVVSDAPVADEALDVQRQQQPLEHPYAAVPVRGGWLVFQL